MVDGRGPCQDLVRAGRKVVAAGLVVGSGGNLSARAEDPDEIWVTPTGAWLDELSVGELSRVRVRDGSLISGPAPTSELALHVATYRARPDVSAIIHLHPQALLLLDALDEPVRLVTTDHRFFVRRVARTPFHPPGGTEVAEAAADASRDGTDCVVLGNHGCSVLGDSVDLALKRVFNLEEAARLTYAALALGRADSLRGLPPEWPGGSSVSV
ncbi:class II aldolase [Virgisporangium aliadipatigenens]|uniref:Class II aldolase n=1 Tax=Virgisporangium aliadipatigenens TaxID=741659 RepID=A0A8J3YVV0_9ACTN|nr:class II aldolase/adducin family protein [Virgisporangium aliadipatigenens]GIJ50750.1 class II aldolase [Virgisporangium aliadipatigenens]